MKLDDAGMPRPDDDFFYGGGFSSEGEPEQRTAAGEPYHMGLVCECGNAAQVNFGAFDINIVGVMQWRCQQCGAIANLPEGDIWERPEAASVDDAPSFNALMGGVLVDHLLRPFSSSFGEEDAPAGG